MEIETYDIILNEINNGGNTPITKENKIDETIKDETIKDEILKDDVINEADDKIICPKCNKKFTIHYFRYKHNFKCMGEIEKDYTRPIRQYNKTIIKDQRRASIENNIKKLNEPEHEDEPIKYQDTPNIILNKKPYKNMTSILEYTNKPILKKNNNFII